MSVVEMALKLLFDSLMNYLVPYNDIWKECYAPLPFWLKGYYQWKCRVCISVCPAARLPSVKEVFVVRMVNHDIWARVTKSGTNVYTGRLVDCIVNTVIQTWPSRSSMAWQLINAQQSWLLPMITYSTYSAKMFKFWHKHVSLEVFKLYKLSHLILNFKVILDFNH